MTKNKQPANLPPLYKVTRDGLSPHTNYAWGLPTKDGPGTWHEVEPGPLVEHTNGFHLTSEPNVHWRNTMEVWLVETEGEVVPVAAAPDPEDSKSDVFLARKVRLVKRLTPAELDALGVGVERSFRSSSSYSARGSRFRKRLPEGTSPIVQILALYSDHALVAGKNSGDNMKATILHNAWNLCLTAQMEFKLGDFELLATTCDMSRLSSEWTYTQLVTTRNITGCKAWEAWRKRTPWMWQGERLYEGAELPWGGRTCKVTTIQDSKNSLIVCAYKTLPRDEQGRERGEKKIEKRFTITREALAKADKARKAASRWLEEGDALAFTLFGERYYADSERRYYARGGGDSNKASEAHRTLVQLWTAEERAEAAAWARQRDADKGKERIFPPPAPAFVEAAREAADAHNAIADANYATYRAAVDKYLASKDNFREWPQQAEVEGTKVCAAREALEHWALAVYEGHPAAYLAPAKNQKKAKAAG